MWSYVVEETLDWLQSLMSKLFTSKNGYSLSDNNLRNFTSSTSRLGH